MWNRVVMMLGIHTVLILVERARWITQQQYNEALHITFDETGVSFDELEKQCGTDQAQATASEFISSLVTILTRLVGMDISRRVAQEVDHVLGRED